MIKTLFHLSLLVLASCGSKHSSVDYGKTTVADLIAAKGEPIQEKKVPVKDSKILLYDNDEKYQTKGDLVTHGYKRPKGDEASLIYWKHRFKDCVTSTKKIGKPVGHELSEIQMSCPSEGLTVIYTEGSDVVNRVVEYEKK